MEDDSTATQTAQAASVFTGDAWFDPIEVGIRDTLLHGSAGWRRELGGVGRRPLP